MGYDAGALEPVIQDILGLFQPGRSVAICGHINPDGDSIGSTLALSYFLERARGLEVTRLLARGQEPPALYSFLPGYDFTPAEGYDGSPDIFIAVDLAQAHRLAAARAVLERSGTSVNIDHHPDPEGFADHTLSDTRSPAAGLLVWQLLRSSGEAVTPAEAAACYVAVLTDTGRFSYQNTDQQTLSAAAEMVAAGADPAAIAKAVYDSRPLGSLLLDARLVSRLEFLIEGRVACSWLVESDYRELGVEPEESEGLVGLLRSIQGVELAVLLREDGRQVRVNLRAPGDYDAAKLARDHGGGGHKAAAGFNFAGTIGQAREAIRHYLLSEALLTPLPDAKG